MIPSKISTLLSIEASGPAVTAKLAFTCHSPLTELLQTVNAGLHERFAPDAFVILRGGEPVPFRGPRRKLSLADSEKYRSIQPGETVFAEVHIERLYDLTTPGLYVITYEGVHGSASSGGVFVVTSNTFEWRV